jgi:hypothetical protein
MKEYKNFQLGCVNSGNFVYQGDSNLKWSIIGFNITKGKDL